MKNQGGDHHTDKTSLHWYVALQSAGPFHILYHIVPSHCPVQE